MPELPDVEIFKQYLDATSLHQKIARVAVEDARVLEWVSQRSLGRALTAHRFQSTRRHGKHLMVEVDQGPWLTLHFGMTGYLKYFQNPDHRPAHVRVLVSFTNGYHLAYVSQRMLGTVGLTDDPENFIREKGLGPDALEINFEDFREILAGKRGRLKSTLMNQGYVAGLGNDYTDEILFHCGLHPMVKTNTLDDKQLKNLFQEMQQTLQEAIRDRADPQKFPATWLLPRRHEGGECPRGHGHLKKVKVSGRTAYFCPQCQTQPWSG